MISALALIPEADVRLGLDTSKNWSTIFPLRLFNFSIDLRLRTLGLNGHVLSFHLVSVASPSQKKVQFNELLIHAARLNTAVSSTGTSAAKQYPCQVEVPTATR